jgi:hypothetical protein
MVTTIPHSQPSRWPAQSMTSPANDKPDHGQPRIVTPDHVLRKPFLAQPMATTVYVQNSPWPDKSIVSTAYGKPSPSSAQPMVSQSMAVKDSPAHGSPDHFQTIPWPDQPMASTGHSQTDSCIAKPTEKYIPWPDQALHSPVHCQTSILPGEPMARPCLGRISTEYDQPRQ